MELEATFVAGASESTGHDELVQGVAVLGTLWSAQHLGDYRFRLSVRFDARRGFPRSASIDSIKNAVDDEIGWTVDRFRVLH
jgi:hypothetical protein